VALLRRGSEPKQHVKLASAFDLDIITVTVWMNRVATKCPI
jgi:hypothetical protein